MILVDSSVWIDYFRGTDSPGAARLHTLLGEEPLLMGDLILAEVLQGFTRNTDFQRAARLLASLETITIGSRDIAVQAARHVRDLRARGITVRGTVDALIATRCIEDGLLLLHADRDFEPFETHLGLRRLD